VTGRAPRAIALAAAALGLALATSPLAAQLSRRIGGGAGAVTTRLHSDAAGGSSTLSGVGAFLEGRLGQGRVSLELGYLEGRLSADTGTATERDLVDARAMLTVRPVSSLALKAGGHLRGYVQPAGTERWVLWELRAAWDGAVVGDRVAARVELWRAVSASLNLPPGAAGARGGEVGLTFRLARSGVWARFGYAIDRAELENGTTETLEALSLAVGFGPR